MITDSTEEALTLELPDLYLKSIIPVKLLRIFLLKWGPATDRRQQLQYKKKRIIELLSEFH